MQCSFGVRPSPHSPFPSNSTTLHLQRKGCQRFKMPNRTVPFPLPFFFQLLSLCRADLPSSTHGPSSHDSFAQYPTENGSMIIARPLKQPLVNNSVYEDYLHVVVACLLALVLIVLLGLVIRHYGLTLPSLTRFQRSKRQRSPAGDTESSPQSDRRQGVTGLGFEGLEKAVAEGGGLDDPELPEKPEAAHLKWR